MVAVVAGGGLGLERTSAWVLGSRGALGQAALGRAADNVYVNAATGNLVIQNTDEMLIGRGGDAIISRTYNSLGNLTDDNGDNWRASLQRRIYALTGTMNTAGSTISRADWDGSETVFTWDATRSAYVSTDGAGAHDTISYASGAWSWRDGDSRVVETYETTNGNRVSTVTDADGNVQTFTYTASSTRVTTADGNYTELSYSGTLLTQLVTYKQTTAGGSFSSLTRTRYSYDGLNRLSTVTVDLSPGDSSVADGNTYVTAYTYDGSSKRVASISQTDGSILQISYVLVGSDYRVATLTQAAATGLNRVTSFAYDTVNRVTTVTDPAGQATKLSYDAKGQLTQVVSPPAHVGATAQTTKFGYNANGDVVLVDRGGGDMTVYGYDANGNCLVERDALGNVVTRTYGPNNQLLTETRGTTPWKAPTIVFKNADGTLSLRRTTGTGFVETGVLPAPDAAWDKRFVGDVNGDGNLDIIFQQSSTGNLAFWNTNGSQITGSGLLTGPGVGWSVIGVGDFNGDGKDDLLFRNGTSHTVWHMDGALNLSTSGSVGGSGDYSYIGVGDFNGDGKDDILLQQAGTGAIGAWLMNGLTILGSPGYGVPASGAVFKAIGDLNGDGKDDIVFQNGTTISAWFIDGGSVTGSSTMAGLGAGYQLIDASDLDGDGQGDLTFRHTDGGIAYWFLDSGKSVKSWSSFSFSAANTTIGVHGRSAQDMPGQTTRYVYNAENHLRFVVSPGGRITEYRYNSYGQLAITIEYPDHAYSVSALGKDDPISETQLIAWVAAMPDKSSTKRTETLYDFRGNLQSVVRYGRTLADGNGDTSAAGEISTTTYVYDQAGKLLTRQVAGQSGSETFAYDGLGRLISATDFSNATTRTVFRDSASTTSVVLANGLTQTSVYNRAGELISYSESERGANLVNLNGWPTGVSGEQGPNLINTAGWPTGVNAGVGENLVDLSWWPDASNPVPAGAATLPSWYNNLSAETRWALTSGPDGKQIVAIQAGQFDGVASGGGNLTNPTTVDGTKAYEFTYYFRKSDLTKHSVYFGLSQGAPAYVEYATDGSDEGNPYFYYAASAAQQAGLVQDRWYKVVGYVLPQGSANVAVGSLGGVYDTVTGAKITNVNTFRWNTPLPNTSVHSRFFDYYDEGQSGYSTYFGQPEIRALDNAAVLPSGPATVPGWPTVGYETEARWSLVNGPDGRQIVAMQAGQSDAYEWGGGAHTNSTPIDGGKAYEFTLYFRKSDLTKHSIYFGLSATTGGYVENAWDGGASDNPYFMAFSPGVQQSALSNDRWYKVVGYVLPEGSANIAWGSLGGIYDTVTGAKVSEVQNFRWRAGRPDNNVHARFFDYYDGAQTGYSTYFAPPEMREVSGYSAIPGGNAVIPGALNWPWMTDEARWSLVDGPDGKQIVAIETGQTNASADGGGGDTGIVTIDGSKAYEFTYYFRKSDLANHNIYFGLMSQSSPVEQATPGVGYAADGYFYAAQPSQQAAVLQENRWYKVVGYVLPQGSANVAAGSLGGVYDAVTGERVTDTAAFRWSASRPSNEVYSRFFTYYGEGQQGYTTQFGPPEIREVSTATVDNTPVAATTQYRYDSLGRLRIVTDPTGVRTYSLYDRVGRKTADIDADGSLTEYGYDSHDRLVKTVRYATRLTAGEMATLTDAYGNPAEVDVGAVRPSANAADVWEWRVYDKAGKLIESIDAAGAVTAYSYDGLSQLVSTTRYSNPLSASLVSGFKVATPTGLVLPAADAANDRTTRYFYDGSGRPIGVLDAEGYLTRTIYDGAGQKIETVAYEYAVTAGLRATGDFAQVLASASNNGVGYDNDIHNWFLYDNRGLLMASIDGQATLTRYHYNQAGFLDSQIRGQALDLGVLLTTRPTLASLPAAPGGTLLETTTYARDGYGQLLTETKALTGGANEQTSYVYDGVGNLIRVTVAANTADPRAANRRYDLRGRLIGELSGLGSVELAALGGSPSQAQIDAVYAAWGTTYAYDDADRLILRTGPGGSPTTGDRTLYFYNTDGALTHTLNSNGWSAEDEMGELVEHLYDALGRRTSTIVHAGRLSMNGLEGGTATAGFLASVTMIASASDSETQLAYDVRGNVTASSDALARTSFYAYSSFGELTAAARPVTPGEYVYSALQYDRRGLVRHATLDSQAGGLQLLNSTVYDAFGRAIQTTDAAGKVRSASYDRTGRLVTTTDALGQTTVYGYDRRGNVIQLTDRAGKTTTWAYTAFNRQMTMTTPENVVTVTQVNAHGQTISVTDGAGRLTSYAYDKDGNLTSVTEAGVQVQTNSYSTAGRLNWTVDGRGSKTSYSYDGVGRTLTRKEDDGGLNLVTAYAYDAKGQQVTVTDAAGVPTTITYDKAGRKTAVTLDPNGLVPVRTEYTYDQGGRVLTVTEGAQTAAAVVTQYVYDKADRLIQKRVDPAGLNITTSYAYDANGNVGAVTDALGRITRYTYDAENRLTLTLDAGGFAVAPLYDAEGRVTQSIQYVTQLTPSVHAALPLICTFAQIAGPVTGSTVDRTTRFAYDGDGRVRFSVDAMGQVTAYAYDGAGAVVKQTRYHAAYTATGTLAVATMQTWANANVSDANRITRWIYDGAGRAVYEIDPESYVTERQYDGAGLVTKTIRYADWYAIAEGGSAVGVANQIGALPGTAAVTSYAYDGAGRLTTVTDATGSVTRMVLDAMGRVTDTTRAYGTADAATTHAVYDKAGRVTSETRGYGTAEASTSSYSYDAIGRVLTSTNGRGFTTSYAYDKVGRVVTETVPLDSGVNAVTTKQYDAAGNLVKVTDARGNAGYFYYDALDRLIIQVDPEGYVTGTIYSAGGKPVSVARYALKATGAYSATLRPTVTPQPANDAYTQFGYDKLDRLLWSMDAEGHYEEYTLNAFGDRIAERNKLGGVTINAYDKRGLLTIETLPVGSTRANGTVQSTTIVNRFEYDARGNRTKTTEASGLTEQRITVYTYDKLDRLVQTTGDAVPVLASTFVGTTAYAVIEAIAYDRRGNVVETVKAGGARTLFYYDDLDRKTAEVNALGTLSTWTYDAAGNAIAARVYADAVTLPGTAGGTAPAPVGSGYRETTYAYDRNNRMISASVAGLRTGQYGSSYVASLGAVTTSMAYDAMGNVLSRTDGRGALTYSFYDKLGRETARLDAERYLTTYVRDAEGNVVTETRFATAYVGVVGSAAPTVASNAVNDRVTTFTYDRNGRRLTESRLNVVSHAVDASGAMSSGATTATIVYTYNGLGAVTRKTEANGDSRFYAYDAIGRQLASWSGGFTDYTGAAVQNEIGTSYDGLGNVTRTSEGKAGVAGSGIERITTFAYGAGGRLTSVTDPTGFTRHLYYDSRGNLAHQSYIRQTSTGSSEDGAMSVYDALGRVVMQTTATWSGGVWTYGDRTHLQYNAFGEVTGKGVTAGGVTTPVYQETFAYDAGGRMWKSNTGDGSTRLFVHDAIGAVTLTIASNGGDLAGYATIEAALTALGAAATGAAFSADIITTITVYDKRGQNVAVREHHRELATGAGGVTTKQDLVRSKVYNAFGEVIQETDARNNATDFAYNTMGRLTKKESPTVWWTGENGVAAQARPTEHYYYDLSGRLVGTRDANGNLNRRILLAGSGHGDDEAIALAEFHAGGTDSANSGVYRTGVDVFGDARTLTDELGKVETRTYDKAGRVVSITRPPRTTGATPLTESYAYDGLGQRIKHWNSQFGASVTERTDYDRQGRVVSFIDYANNTTSYAYVWNAAADTDGLGVFGGWTKTTTHVSGKTAIEVQDYFGREVDKTDMGGHVTTRLFDKAGRVIRETNGADPVYGAGEILRNVYYNTGRIARTDDISYPTVPLPVTFVARFDYDANGNRVSESYVEYKYSKTRDWETGVWDEQWWEEGQGYSTGMFDALNRVTSITGGVNVTYQYDLNSNVRRILAPNAYVTNGSPAGYLPQDYWYRYDSQNRLVTTKGTLSGGVISRGTTGTDISYDAASQRATAVSNSSSEAYAYTDDGYLSTVHIGGVLRVTDYRDLLGRVTSHTELKADGTNAYARTAVYDVLSQVTSDVTVVAQSDGSTFHTSSNYIYTALSTTAAGVAAGAYMGGAVTHTYTTASTRIGPMGGTSNRPETDTKTTFVFWDEVRQNVVSFKPNASNGTTYTSGFQYDYRGHLVAVNIADGRPRQVRYATDLTGQIINRYEWTTSPESGNNPYENYYYFNGLKYGETGNNGTLETDYATAITRRYAAPQTGAFRFGGKVNHVDFDQNYEPINSGTPRSGPSSYGVQDGDTLQSIAAAVWGDSSLWYLIADANGLDSTTSLVGGMSLTIPVSVTNLHNTSSTFKVYDPNKAIGDINPTTPKPPPKGKSCGAAAIIVAIIAVVVVAIVAPYMSQVMTQAFAGAGLSTSVTATAAAAGGFVPGTAIAASSAAGLAGTIAGGAIAGAAASIVSQGAAMAMGIQDKFSWNAVGMGALGGAVGGGFKAAGMFQGNSAFVNGAMRGAASSVITQGVGVATGMQKKFDWAGIAVSAIGGGVGDLVRGSEFLSHMSSDAADAVSGFVGGVAGVAAQSLVTGTDFGDNLMAALPGIIGNTIGGMIAGRLSTKPSAPSSKVGNDHYGMEEVPHDLFAGPGASLEKPRPAERESGWDKFWGGAKRIWDRTVGPVFAPVVDAFTPVARALAPLFGGSQYYTGSRYDQGGVSIETEVEEVVVTAVPREPRANWFKEHIADPFLASMERGGKEYAANQRFNFDMQREVATTAKRVLLTPISRPIRRNPLSDYPSISAGYGGSVSSYEGALAVHLFGGGPDPEAFTTYEPVTVLEGGGIATTVASGLFPLSRLSGPVARTLDDVGTAGARGWVLPRPGDPNFIGPLDLVGPRLPSVAEGARTTTVFRVQGGTPPSASRQLIKLDEGGNVSISNSTLNVSLGSEEHAAYFLSKRPGAEVVSFDIPDWMGGFIRSEAVPQFGYSKNPLSQGGLAPKIVDASTPGTSYELPPIWAKWLEEVAVPGSGKVSSGR